MHPTCVPMTKDVDTMHRTCTPYNAPSSCAYMRTKDDYPQPLHNQHRDMCTILMSCQGRCKSKAQHTAAQPAAMQLAKHNSRCCGRKSMSLRSPSQEQSHTAAWINPGQGTGCCACTHVAVPCLEETGCCPTKSSGYLTVVRTDCCHCCHLWV